MTIWNFITCKKKSNEEKKKIKKNKFSNEPLCSFVNSAFNIEFVYLILLSINTFMSNRQFTLDRQND